ncbi:MAG: Transglutaminase domain-containing protein [Candidatus Levybacteria bacterium GW2011_GWA2_40_8]|nr:MAG: Transglutaminase domain-containing protein [Candidatus Levybacteria bacterium GW2011_GWA2_40_8]
MRKIILLIFLLLLLLFPKASFASEFFETDAHVSYFIQNTGRTNVRFETSLTNKTGESYASSYTLFVGFKNLENVAASDSTGPAPVNLETSDRGSEIKVTFNDRVVGQGNRLNFTISFDTFEVAQSQGRIWEVNVPGLENINDFEGFTASVIVPENLGRPVYIKPEIKRVATSSSTTTVFTKSELGSSGISMAYGDYQVYKFNLRYHLENTNLFPVKTEIALPPTTNYQDVSIDDIFPRPSNVVIDTDGNWLAKYTLKPRGKLEINVLGNAKINLMPRSSNESSEDLNKYLAPTKHWQADSSDIRKLAKELGTPEKIYDYVLDNLTYDFERVRKGQVRLGALKTLKNPDSAVCLEFSDLFIALARAAGIPAREVNGFAYTENSTERPLSLIKDILHAWPEYYDKDKKTWTMIDPTWGNTTNGVDYFKTLDFDHFAFVIRGVDSEYPIPAGGYKFEGNESVKDVEVSLSRLYKTTEKNISISSNFSNSYIAGFPIEGKVTIENRGGEIFKGGILNASGRLLKNRSYTVDSIPPFGKSEVKVVFTKTPFLTNSSEEVRIILGEKTDSAQFKISPIFLNLFIILGGIFIGALSIIIFFTTKKLRSIYLRGQGK